MSNQDNLPDIIRDSIKTFNENIQILSCIESCLESEKEDHLIPCLSKTDLIDMVYEVVDSVRMKKAESGLMQRQLEHGLGS